MDQTGIGATIQAARLDLGLTQRQLAGLCRTKGYPVSDSQISKIERGESAPWPSTLLAIAMGLGTTPRELRAGAKVAAS